MSIAAVIGASPLSVTSVSENFTFTLTVLSVRAVPFSSFTKSRPVVNVSWILYTYCSYPVVSGIEPV